MKVLQVAATAFGFTLDYDQFDHTGADYYLRTGHRLPDDWFDELARIDSIFFGAVGWPEVVPDHVSLWGSLLQVRQHFDQYISLCPVKLPPRVLSPLVGREPGDIDFYVVREDALRHVLGCAIINDVTIHDFHSLESHMGLRQSVGLDDPAGTVDRAIRPHPCRRTNSDHDRRRRGAGRLPWIR